MSDRWDSPAVRVVRVLLLLVVLGITTGQILGHVLATGIEHLLDVIAL